MSNTKPKKRDRKATEQAIVEAFSRVVERDGLAAAHPTSVMAEAGYSKPLLYDYFGDMRGLVQAWFDQNQIWPDYDFPDTITSDDELKQCLKKFLLSIAQSLRENSIALEFLAAEVTHSFEYKDILEKSRKKWMQKNLAAVMSHPDIQQDDNMRLLFVVYNAICYLALRSRLSARQVGLQLNEDHDWAEAMTRVENVIDDLIQIHQFRRQMKNEPK